MTAVSAVHTTRGERAVLDLAARLERLTMSRAHRRAARDAACVLRAAQLADLRADAQALGWIGILPR